MKVDFFRQRLNDMLNGEMLSKRQTTNLFNMVLDDVNSTLSSKFPYMTLEDTEYTAIPDKWLNSVFVPGAAHMYYLVDDEGTPADQGFNQKYEVAKFTMLRDFMVPEEYDDDTQGYKGDFDSEQGIWIPARMCVARSMTELEQMEALIWS